MWTHRLLSLFAAAASLYSVAACKNPRYCAGNPDNDCREDPDGPRSCSGDGDCSTPAGVCDLGATMTCVPCTTSEPGACTGTTPACVDNQCQKCTEHAQCAISNVCLPDGSCADPTQVAYVQAGGSGTMCTQEAPCGTLGDGVSANKPTVKIESGTVADSKTTTIDGKAITILADPGAKLDRTGDSVILEVKNSGADVQIFDLEITGGTGAITDAAVSVPSGGAPKLTLTRVKIDGNQGVGISAVAGTLAVSQSTVSGNAGGGISVTGGTLTVSQSTVSGNAGGGISVTGGTFVIISNVFFANGSILSNRAGLYINTNQAAMNRLEFNSFNQNLSQSGGSAVDCTAGTFTARNNIMSGNGTLTNQEQVGGTCAHAYSIVRPGTLPAGTGNIAGDPLFKNTTTGDLHLQPGSPAAGAADPGSDLTGIAAKDLDGDARTKPADLGADELP